MKEESRSRKNLRMPHYNYSNTGYYFITICVKNRKKLLSKIIITTQNNNIKLELLPYGKIADRIIKNTNNVYDYAKIYDYVIMPNHIHFICEITKNINNDCSPQNATIPNIVGALKKLINKECKEKIWQRNYYEHIIRNEKEYLKILQYIYDNPYRWGQDLYYI